MKSFRYPYTRVNQLQEPCKYTYTEFKGAVFLKSYFESRSPYLKSAISFSPGSVNNLMESVRASFASTDDQFPDESTILESSEVHIYDILGNLSKTFIVNGESVDSAKCLNKLVQRYEVSKKIYNVYGVGLSQGHGTYQNLNVYLTFGFILAFAYVQSHNLQYLSTLLKVCDLLISAIGEDVSMNSSEFPSNPHLTLGTLVEIELHLVNQVDPIEKWTGK